MYLRSSDSEEEGEGEGSGEEQNGRVKLGFLGFWGGLMVVSVLRG